MDLNLLSARRLLEGYARAEFTPVDVARACLARIEATQGALNAFCLIDSPRTLAEAGAPAARWATGAPQGPLDGVPVSIKDLIDVAGWPTLSGSNATSPETHTAARDAAQVARLRAAGAVILGKTTTTEFGHKGVSDSPRTGATRNPWNLALTTGGSSCGAGAAAAAGLGPLHLGNDGGGSVRIPASFCGVIGVKPGAGTLVTDRAGITGPLVASGPLTRHAGDAALLLDVIAHRGPVEADGTLLSGPGLAPGAFSDGLALGASGLRIGWLPTLSGAPVEAETAALVRAGLEVLCSLGAEAEETALDLPRAEEAYITILSAGTALFVNEMSPGQRALMEPALMELVRVGMAVTAAEYAHAYHRLRGGCIASLRALFTRYDLLVLPTMPAPAFPLFHDYPGPQDRGWRADWTPFTFPFNLAGLPAASLPCGLTGAGLPVGMQVVAPWGHEARLMGAVAAFCAAAPAAAPPDFITPEGGNADGFRARAEAL
ncbi:amidase family protein [Oceanicella sp. SM1341]|uniref:amidase family protein n=1 Tax=Oceanicella sp. SM1341 TaxID=1548889 RepID=UPI0013009A75|nr:amidase family protein [Oceanicella sp. SM1341]